MAMAPTDWIGLQEAETISGLTYHQIRKLMRKGHFTVRHVPNTRPLLSRDEVERLVEVSVKPATVAASA